MRPLLLVLLLAGCAPAVTAPSLVPLGPVLAAADALPAGATFAPGLQSEADALAVRASSLPSPADPALLSRLEDLGIRAGGIPTPGSSEAERLALLRARAEALRDGVLSDEERRRLGEGPSLPPGSGPANSAPEP